MLAFTEGYVKEYIENKDYKVLSRYRCGRKIQVECPRGHSYPVNFHAFKQGTRCRQCTIQRQKLTLGQVRQYIEQESFALKSTQYQNSRTPLVMECSEGHECHISWNNFKFGIRCRKCSTSSRNNNKRYDIFLVEDRIISEGYEVVSDLRNRKNSKDKFIVQCPKQHTFTTCWNYWQRGHRCLKCHSGHSRAEREMSTLYKDLFLIERDRVFIKPKEIDIFFPNHKVAIEHCGLYWHSEYALGRSIVPSYHRIKLELCARQGVHLLTIFEDEWRDRKNICTSRINCALNHNTVRVYARNTVIKEIPRQEANGFLQKTHLQGSSGCKIAFGLYHNDILVQVMTFGSPARAHTSKGKRVLEMKRLASVLDTIVIGGASKLFKLGLQYAKDNDYEIIKSYCDLRWGTGNLYKKLGFTKTYETRYTPHYTDGVNRYRNQNLAQNKNKTGTTEKEVASRKGLWKIYDCGHSTWEYRVQ